MLWREVEKLYFVCLIMINFMLYEAVEEVSIL